MGLGHLLSFGLSLPLTSIAYSFDVTFGAFLCCQLTCSIASQKNIDSYYAMLISFQLVINLDDYSLNQVDTPNKN